MQDTVQPVIRKRVPRDPTPRFKYENAEMMQLAGKYVPAAHLARKLLHLVEQLDVSQLEKCYSALGQHGYHPRWLLGCGSTPACAASTTPPRLCKRSKQIWPFACWAGAMPSVIPSSIVSAKKM